VRVVRLRAAVPRGRLLNSTAAGKPSHRALAGARADDGYDEQQDAKQKRERSVRMDV